jgi:2',3'-cyclic-nucleotide 2'-phosphodiesterase (5'-nucleotidase family)
MKTLLFLTAVSCIFLAIPERLAPQSVTVYYTASLNGNLDGCDCKGNPRAGLVKSAAFLRSVDPSSALLIDLGDALGVYEDRALHGHILRTYGELGYDLLMVGDQEFVDGPGILAERCGDYPYYSSNLRLSGQAAGGSGPAFGGKSALSAREPLVFERNGVRLGIVAITDPRVFRFYEPDYLGSAQLEDPVKRLSEELEALRRRQVDAALLVFHGYTSSLAELVKRSRLKPDFILFAHEQILAEARLFHGVPAYSPGNDGNRVGILRLTARGKGLRIAGHSFRYFSYLQDEDDPRVRERIETYNSSLRSTLPTGE